MYRIGVLALQGAFAKHVEMLKSLEVEAFEVRTEKDLEKCDALIIPGGESTAIHRLLTRGGLSNSLLNFTKTHPVFGTCAGLILMSKEIIAEPASPFGCLAVSVERNAYGRQADSFQTTIDVQIEGRPLTSFPALFIRAPRIRHWSDEVEILASYEGEPVLIKQGQHLGATFHPELTNNSYIHAYFVKIVRKSK